LTDVSREDIERLANRLALLVSDDGEAENAGRAIGQLARRLSLTGGDLKEMFLSGATVAGPATRQARQATSEAERLENEVFALRTSLRQALLDVTNAEQERDALYHQVAALQTIVFKRNTNTKMRRVGGSVVLLAAGIAAFFAYIVPIMRGPERPAFLAPDAALVGKRVATVRASRTTIYIRPDREAPVMGVLPSGTRVAVRRVFWNLLMQWAEIELAGATGYVFSTDLEMS
jgi:hypothetical protein